MLALASPASLKSVLKPVEAALALAAGLREGGAEALELPVADGGEGTTEVIASAREGRWGEAEVTGPLGEGVQARYLVLEDGSAVVEAAEAIGLRLASRLDPLAASSQGLGELMLAAAAEASGPIIIGLGVTATVDGGAGLLEPSAPRRVGRPRSLTSSSAGWRRWSSSDRTRTCPARAQPVGSARRWRL